MATNSSFEDRLNRIGAGRGEGAEPAPSVIPDERRTTRRLIGGISVVLVLAVGVSVATTTIGALGGGERSYADDGWEPVVSKGVPVGDGSAQRAADGWLKLEGRD